MEATLSALPGMLWGALCDKSDKPPREALERIAEAWVSDPGVWDELRRRYERFFADDSSYLRGTFEPVTIPAVIALAGRRLPTAARVELAEWAIAQVDAAVARDDECQCEIWNRVLPVLMPEIIEPAARWVERIAAEDDRPLHRTCWLELWCVLARVKPDAEESLRRRVADLAERMIREEMAGRFGDRIKPDYLEDAQWALTILAPDRMRALWEQIRAGVARVDYWLQRSHKSHLRELRGVLNGGPLPDYAPIYDQIRPVEEWLPVEWEQLREWYERPKDPREELSGEEEPGADDVVIPPLDGWLDEAGPIVREQPKVGRNEPCPCGSGKKYKKCCGR